MKKLLICFFVLLQAQALLAQKTDSSTIDEQMRLVYFTDKSDSPFSVQQPLRYLSQKALDRRGRQQIPVTLRDLPVNPAYVHAIKQLDVPVWYTTRWFNGAVVQCSDAELAEIEALPFVKKSHSLNRKEAPQQVQEKGTLAEGPPDEAPDSAAELYGATFHQANMLGAVELHQEGFRGEGMTIAVLDAGFPNVNTLSAFSHLFENNQLAGTFDFVLKQQDVYQNSSHGTSVLSTMAAYLPGKMVGTAYKANFLLLRTEDAASEHTIEEINWLLAAEFADSAGADVLNSSLGYTTFQAPSLSYAYNDMNGNTALVTRAADYAAATGMLVVVSAGNEGAKEWKYISAPADADSVLTVGAVDSLGVLAPFSSVGPASDGRLKPDVVGLGWNAYFLDAAGKVVKGNGTSFSGPIVAGMATCLWQANSTLSNMGVIELLRQSGSNAGSPDNNMGYGIPRYTRTTTSLAALTAHDNVTITNPVEAQQIELTLGADWAQQEAIVQVYDLTGRLMFSQSLPPHQQKHVLWLQPQRLRRGIYICSVESADKHVTLRFLKL